MVEAKPRLFLMVRTVGVEPTRSCDPMVLSHSCLPVSTRPPIPILDYFFNKINPPFQKRADL